MKTARTLALFMGLATFVIISCQKSDVARSASKPEDTEVTISSQPAVRLENGSLLSSSGVTITAPEQVDVNETFNITAAVDCGRIAIERGYILANGNKVYTGLTCNTPDITWESVINFQCASSDASWSGSLGEPGTYIFRTMHNQSKGGCNGSTDATCTTFSGTQFCCFMIEAVDACETSFTGEAIACGTEREAVFTFTSEDAHSYIKIQGGLTNFTGANAEVTVTDPTGRTVSQTTPGGSTNRVITVEGGIDACETITIRITWNSTNSGGIITGSWSVKDANGVELAPAVEGLTCGN